MDLDIDQIDPAEAQPRGIFRESKLEELAQSIRQRGIIQPLVVRRRGERFQIIAGERRWRAAQRAGLHRIPCVVKEVAEDDVLEISLIENIQREELNPLEEANAYKRLLEKQNLTQEQVAQRVGKDRSSITNALRLLKLPIEVQRLVEEDKLSMGHARALLSVDSEESQVRLAREIVSKHLSVRDAEKLAKRSGDASLAASRRRGTTSDNVETANVRAAEDKLSRRLGSPVKIKFAGTGGIIEIKFSSSDDLARLFDTLIRSHATLSTE
jgi:ParB family chromosome partitioning protein